MANRLVSAARQVVRDFGTCLKATTTNNSYVDFATKFSAITSPFAIEGWINLNVGGGGDVFSHYYSYANDKGWYLTAGSSGLQFANGQTFYSPNVNIIKFTPNRWYHVAATYDGTTLYTYVNGILQRQVNITLKAKDASSTYSLLLAQDKTSTFVFKGLIDDFRFYNVYLTQAQIQSAYYNGTTFSPLGWWKMDEGSGTTLNDSSGNGNTGAITNASYSTQVFMKPRSVATNRFVVKNFVKSLLFNYTTNQIDCGTTLTSTFQGTDWSVAGWTFLTNDSTQNRVLCTIGSDGTRQRLQFMRGSTRVIRIGFWGDDYDGTKRIYPLRWNHWCATFKASTKQLIFYLNGISETPSTRGGVLNVPDNSTFYIGQHPGLTNSMGGYIDEVVVYNRVLTSAEVTSIYCGYQVPTSGLQGYWKFDEGSGTSATDSSGNGHTGTITGATYSNFIFMTSRSTV